MTYVENKRYRIKSYNRNKIIKFCFNYFTAAEKDTYFLCGLIMAMSLAHGGRAPMMFSKAMYQWISEGYTAAKSELTVEDVPVGTDVHNMLQIVSTCIYVHT